MAETQNVSSSSKVTRKSSTATPAASKKTAAVADTPAGTATTAAAKPRKASAKGDGQKSTWIPSNEERYNMVQVAAYYLAERDNFAGNPVEYWTQAEAQVSGMLSK